MAGLRAYRGKRDFTRTDEPQGGDGRSSAKRASAAGARFCVQKHAARSLHFDLRLELDGVLKSWAVPKGPSYDPAVRRLAVEVEDHPVEYGEFEGTIPKGEYGGGTVMLWDAGVWEPVEGDPHAGLQKGELKFHLTGERLVGGWVLVRTGGPLHDGKDQWLLIKERDDRAQRGGADAWGDDDRSVKSGRTMAEIAAGVETRAAGGEARAPATVPLSLATLVESPPDGGDWLHEIKYDGYRIAARIENGALQLLTRNGLDWTERFAAVAGALAGLPTNGTWIDGEMVVFGADGVSDFGSLQKVLKGSSEADLTYVAFDLLFEDGEDLRDLPLRERKRRLQRLLARGRTPGGVVRYGDHLETAGADFYAEACRHGLEGVVSKRAGDAYAGRRTKSWLKTKCSHRQEFVIGGFTEPGGAREGFGALLIGVHDADGRLRYAGRVGSGFDDAVLRDLSARLRAQEQAEPAFVDPPRGAQARGVHWVSPSLVTEVSYAEWTADGRLRHPVFQGVREDKAAAQVAREAGAQNTPPKAAPAPGAAETSFAGVKISHPQRVVFPDPGLTKLDVAGYYDAVAGLMVPYLEKRPLTVIRCPGGTAAQCFFQKHVTASVPRSVSRVRVRGGAGTKAKEDTSIVYPVVDTAEALLAMVQNGAVEFHVWGSRDGAVESPDMLVFDIDPGPGVQWQQVREAALTLREELSARGLESFLKTSGGKGLHVVAPFRPRAHWPRVSAFAREVVDTLVAREPDRYTATMSKAKRGGKVFIDHFRNGRGATSVAPYSLRARPGAPVALPIAWEELGRTSGGGQWTAGRVLRRIASGREDPWARFFELGAGQELPEARRTSASGHGRSAA